MPLNDERNSQRMGPPQYPGHAEITPAMVDSVRQRITDAGCSLTIWAVLHEDRYDSPVYADDEDDSDPDFGLSVRGIALNSVDADRLAALDAPNPFSKWIVKGFRLGLVDDLPAIMNSLASLEGITLNDVVEILSEIPPGGTALMRRGLTGLSRRCSCIASPASSATPSSSRCTAARWKRTGSR